eukprot:403374629
MSTSSGSIFKMVGHGLKFISCGKISSGLAFKGRREYTSLTASIISILGMIGLFVMIVIALDDCVKRKYMESDVEQGQFSYENLQAIDTLMNRMDIMTEVVTTIPNFCLEQYQTGYMIVGDTYFELQTDCVLAGTAGINFLYQIKFSKEQDNGKILLQDRFLIDLNFRCGDPAKCTVDPKIRFYFYVNDYFLNADNEIFKQRQKYQLTESGKGLIYISKPIQTMKTNSIFGRNPVYEKDLFFENEFDFDLSVVSKGYTFQAKLEQTDQYDLWTTVHSYPRSFSYTMVQIGGLISFFGMFVCCLRFLNQESLNKELYRHHAAASNYDIEHQRTLADDPQRVFSMEQFIEMKQFIEKIKEVPEVQRYLEHDERTSIYNSSFMDKGEQRLLRGSTMKKKTGDYIA